MLQGHIEEHSLSGWDRLFTCPRRTTQKEHSRACRLVGLRGYTIHDHRHTVAVQLARVDMPLHLLQQQLGHATIQMTMRYARFHPEYSDVEEYFDRLEANLQVGSHNKTHNNHKKDRA